MKPWVTPADVVSAVRLPLAVVFPFLHQPAWQLAAVGLAAASDFLDGVLARRFGSSRAGVLLDPVADKSFMASAFVTIARSQLLHPLEIVAVLGRDIIAVVASTIRWLLRRPVAVPARAGGKIVTAGQLLTLVAVIAGSPLARPLAWATAAVGLYAIWDYARAAARAGASHPTGGVMRTVWAVAIGATLAVPLASQEFHPPPVQRAHAAGTRIGLFGFGVRSGADLSGRGSAVLGVALDLGSIGVDRLRLRASAEIGILNGPNTYVGSIETVYRLAGDRRAVIPYAGAGLAVAGHAGCGADAGCPALWGNAVLGIEIRYRSTFNWLLEYHALDLFRRSRVYVGLTTRRGN